ncbi:MAG: hypothetical protein QW063_02820 [Candidatus Nanoarchaeia archaeon]
MLKQRLEYVDIWRGTAILIMIFIQIFDYLSKKNIYTDAPWYVSAINSVTWVPPAWLFTFVIGASLVLLIEKYSYLSKAQIFNKAVIKYGKYIIISLPFTWFMWGLHRYLGWEEALQGLGLTAIFAAAILLAKPKNKHLFSLIIGLGLLHALLNSADFAARNLSLAASIAANALWRGWFSVSNLLPFMLAGAMFFKLIRSGKSLYKIALLALAFIAFAIVLHFSGFAIDFYNRSFSHIIFGIGQSALIVIATFALWDKHKSAAWRPLSTMGKLAFPIYIGHYLFILKTLELTGLKDTFSDTISILLTMMLIITIYLIAEAYFKLKASLIDKI